jgi:transposase
VILNFQELATSEVKAQSRLAAAEEALGKRAVERMLAFSSYLLGFSREDIAQAFNYTVPGLMSMVQRVYEEGPLAFLQTQGPRPVSSPSTVQRQPAALAKPAEAIEVEVRDQVMSLKLNVPMTLQIPFDPTRPADQIFVLKCQSAGWFRVQQAAEFLDKTPNQIQHMRRKLEATGSIEAVLDLRQGQQQAYKFTEEARSELLYYLFEDLVEFRSISSIRIHDKIQKTLKVEVTDRTIRNYLDELGLPGVKERLIELAKKKIPPARVGGTAP